MAVKVAVYPDDLGGCGHYRMIWPAEALAAQGADVTVHRPDQPQLDGVWEDDDTGVPVLVDIVPPDADIVVLQRPLRAAWADAVTMLQAHGKLVVVDIDDDFSAIHRRNVSFEHVHPKLSPGRNFQHLRRACAQADLVTVTTHALAQRYGKHGRVSVIPNHVPERYLTVDKIGHDGGLHVGWTGSIETHPTDLQVTRGEVGLAVFAADAKFAVVGTGSGVRKALALVEDPVATGWVDIDDYPTYMAQLDIGVVPLDDIAFNHGKSCLKGLEFAAVGVPFVASPVEDYVRLAKLGAGVLADRPKRWRSEIERLLRDDDHRAELAARGRATAARLTIEGNAGRWWDAWTGAKARRRAA